MAGADEGGADTVLLGVVHPYVSLQQGVLVRFEGAPPGITLVEGEDATFTMVLPHVQLQVIALTGTMWTVYACVTERGEISEGKRAVGKERPH